MATQLQDDFEDDDPLELTDDMQVDDDAPDDDGDDGGDAHGPEPDDEDDVPTFDDGEVEAEPTDLVKHLRQQIRERDKKLAEVRHAEPVEPAIVVGDKPTLEGCDYDADRYEAERDAWDGRRNKAAEQASKRDADQQRQQTEWQGVQERYQQGKAALRYPDKVEVEESALASLSGLQQAVIARHADEPAKFIYALGKNPAHLAKLSAIEDPIALAKAMTLMEAKLTTKKTSVRPPDPVRQVRGKPPSNATGDKRMQQLEAEAAKTNDRSKITAYKAELRSKAK